MKTAQRSRPAGEFPRPTFLAALRFCRGHLGNERPVVMADFFCCCCSAVHSLCWEDGRDQLGIDDTREIEAPCPAGGLLAGRRILIRLDPARIVDSHRALHDHSQAYRRWRAGRPPSLRPPDPPLLSSTGAREPTERANTLESPAERPPRVKARGEKPKAARRVAPEPTGWIRYIPPCPGSEAPWPIHVAGGTESAPRTDR